jgi:dihydroorotate dehydrogenase electron transfer subunit
VCDAGAAGGIAPAWEACEILGNEALTCDIVYLTVRAPAVAAAALPGQFVHAGLAVPGADDPYLRRPISLAAIDRAAGTVGLVIKAVGRGTKMLNRVRPGSGLDLLGPLGHGFPEQYGGKVLLVGGGIGAAPLMPLAAAMTAGCDAHTAQTRVMLLLGARTAAELWAVKLAGRQGSPCIYSTDDGSAGHPGPVTDLLGAELASGQIAVVCACGPLPMLRAVAALGRDARVATYVSLEQRMACGLGACLGCAWPRSEEAGGGYARVCADGPVFDAREVAL